jgi:inorganic pyrophosphatase
MISPCTCFNPSAEASHHVSLWRSLNLTVPNSPGLVRMDDPEYANIPPDSRKPPAPIDPSGTSTLISDERGC